MNDYQARTIREVRHVDRWGWEVIGVHGRVVMRTVVGEEVLDIEPTAARLLAAALIAAADEAEGKR